MPSQPWNDNPAVHLASDPSFSFRPGAARAPRKDEVEALRLEPDTVLGDFRLVRRLGQGAMGSVWEAEQISLQRLVAFKVIRPECVDEKSIAMFEREGRASGKAHHSGIVAVYGRGEWEGVHYLVQELVGGGHTLADTLYNLKEDPKLPANYFAEVARFIADVAEAMEAAHQAGVIHRDIKPHNILIDDEGRPKITDFGLARIVEEQSVTGDLSILGTYLYMSPEQAAAKAIGLDHRTDVFSLGVVLYEMLALQRPFEGDTEQQILERILNEDPPPPRQVRSRVPLDLSTICMVALEKRREHRYSSMAALAEDLRRFLDRQPILARPPGPLRRAQKWTLRHPAASVGMSTGIVALVVITALLFQTLRAKASADRSAADAKAAATLADQREQEARRDRDASERVTEFLIGLFESSDPSLARGEKVLAKEVLDRGATSVTSSLGQDPLVRAKLMDAMGRAYLSLGLFAEAEPLLQGALHDRQAQLGTDHPDTLASASHLGSLLRWRGKYREAHELLAPTLEKQRHALGEDADATLATLDELGLLSIDQGHYSVAEELLTQALGNREKRFGDEDSATLEATVNLALLYREQGRYDEARTRFEHVVDTRRALSGEDDPGFLEALNNLASVSLLQGNLEEAQRLYETTLEGRRRVLGEEHPETLVTLNDLAYLHMNKGETEAAEALYEKALEGCRRVLGEEHSYTFAVLCNYAVFCMNADRPDDAEALFQQALEGGRTFLGEDHPDTLHYLNSLAFFDCKQRTSEEALPLFEKAFEGCRRVLGEDHPRTLGVQENLARVYGALGEYEKALSLARELLGRTPQEPFETYQNRAKLVELLEEDRAQAGGR